MKNLISCEDLQRYAEGHEDTPTRRMARELQEYRNGNTSEIRNRLKAEGLAELLKDAREYSPLSAAQWETLAKNWHQTFTGLSDDLTSPRRA